MSCISTSSEYILYEAAVRNICQTKKKGIGIQNMKKKMHANKVFCLLKRVK
jgi:hypothetical protein